MKVIKLNDTESIFNRPVTTLGTFDGVHLGHREVLKILTHRASEIQGTSVAITFDVPPRVVLQPDQQTMILTGIDEKTSLIAETGVDYLVIIPFTKEFAALTPAEFVNEYLCNRLGVKEVILGYDHLFGKGGSGGYNQMQELGKQFDFKVMKVNAFEFEGTVVSSSLIRQLISEGNMQKAASFLGYTYTICGKVVCGNKIGRTIGFPTINIEPDDKHKLIPGNGVYRITATIDDILYQGMGNIGLRPTLNLPEPKQSVEAHLFNFERETYGENIKVHFIEKIRDEIKFADINELKNQLELDKALIINKFNNI